MKHAWILSALVLTTLTRVVAADSVSLTGSNGVTASFAGVLEARPEGLVVTIREGDKFMTIAWNRFDLAKMKNTQPAIHAAYLQAVENEKPVRLSLGLFAHVPTFEDTLNQVKSLLDKEYPTLVDLSFDDLIRGTSHDKRMDHGKLRELRRSYSVFLRELGVSQRAKNKSKPIKVGKLMRALAYKPEDVNDKTWHAGYYFLQQNRKLVENIIAEIRKIEGTLPSPAYDATDLASMAFPNELRHLRETLQNLSTDLRIPSDGKQDIWRFYKRFTNECKRMGI